jgi:phosphohistidine phosphatase
MAARTLILIRHAKAAEAAADIDRPLTRRGIRDAGAIGEWLATSEIVPDRVVVSPARRARQTWEGAAAQLSVCPAPELDRRIYDNEVESLLQIVRETPEEATTVVLVGHNPSFGEFAYQLDDGTGDPQARQELVSGFPTSAVAAFEMPGAWADTTYHGGVLRAFAAPRG